MWQTAQLAVQAARKAPMIPVKIATVIKEESTFFLRRMIPKTTAKAPRARATKDITAATVLPSLILVKKGRTIERIPQIIAIREQLFLDITVIPFVF